MNGCPLSLLNAGSPALIRRSTTVRVFFVGRLQARECAGFVAIQATASTACPGRRSAGTHAYKFLFNRVPARGTPSWSGPAPPQPEASGNFRDAWLYRQPRSLAPSSLPFCTPASPGSPRNGWRGLSRTRPRVRPPNESGSRLMIQGKVPVTVAAMRSMWPPCMKVRSRHVSTALGRQKTRPRRFP